MVERLNSPTESTVTVSSHLPPATHVRQVNNTHSRQGNPTSRTNINGTSHKRARGNASAHEHTDSLLDQTATAASARREMYAGGAQQPSLPLPLTNGNGAHYDAEWAGSAAPAQLAGPGVPSARRNGHSSLAMEVAQGDALGVTDGLADADADQGTLYCYCQSPSYGEMIGCDMKNCETEWVSVFDLSTTNHFQLS